MSKAKINDSGDDPTLSSMVDEAETDQEQTLSSTEKSKSRRWHATAKLLRTIRKFNYLKEDPKGNFSGKTLFIKSRSTRVDKSQDRVDDLALVAAETEDEEDDEPLQPLAFKFRMAASLLKAMAPYIYEENGGYNRWINDALEITVRANPKPVNGIYTNDVVIDNESGVWARIFAPSETTDGTGKDLHYPVVVFFHGGGFATAHPNASAYDSLGRKLATASGAILISVSYRLSPDFKFPTQYDDCFKALQWLQATKPGTGSLPATADVSRCFLAGDSAGGNITHQVGCRAVAADLGPVKIVGMILIQPFFGGEERTRSEHRVKNPVLLTNALADWFWRAFLPHGADRDHEASNVFGPNAPDISRLPLPSIFVAIGTHDILKDRQVQYAKLMATIVGNDNITVKKYNLGFHGFFSFDLVLQKALMTDISDFVKGAQAKLPKS